MNDNNRNLILVIIVLVIIAFCCVALVVGALLAGGLGLRLAGNVGGLGNVVASNTYSQGFNVDTPAELRVDVSVGSVEIQVGQGNTIAVNAEIRGYGSTQAQAQEALDQVRFDVTQSGSRVEVTGNWPSGVRWPGRSPEMDVRITVPERAALSVKMDVGSVTLAGTQGDVDVKVNVGKVDVRDVMVPDSLSLQTDVADIYFEGALSQGARYDFSSDVGAVRLVLPADSRFAIDASSNVGSVRVDFDVVGTSSGDLVGKTVQGVVNGGADTPVTIRSDVGAITVRSQ